MDESSSKNESLYARIQQLEQERDELRKEIEQLCMQQAGPNYIAVATQMHFRRTAGLEQEIENLKTKLESCTKENLDLKRELSEARRTTKNLDQLHKLEVTKNTDVVNQLELLHRVVDTAYAERDHAMIEVVKAKQTEDLMSQKLNDAEKRTVDLEQEIENLKKKVESCTKENSDLKKELSEAKRVTKHLDQLYNLEVTKNTEVVKQLELLHGAVDTASAERDHALKEAMKAKENEVRMSQKLSDAEKRIQELSVGSIKTQEQLTSLEIKLAKQEHEMDLFRKIINKFYKIRQHACRGIEEESDWDNQNDDIGWDDKCACLYNDPLEEWSFNAHKEASTANYIAALQEQLETLRYSVDDHRAKLQTILSSKLITDGVSSLREYHAQQRIQIMDLLDDGKSYLQAVVISIEEKLGDLSEDSGSAVAIEIPSCAPNVVQPADPSKAVAKALQDKQEERHLWEVRTALRGTLDELQRNLKQATGEKVDALMELADVKQEYQLLLERTIQERQESLVKRKTPLKRWFSAKENLPPVADPQVGHEGSLAISRSNRSMDYARLQIENATLKDNLQSLKCLTSNMNKLRLSLMQAKQTPVSEGTKDGVLKLLDDIIWEAELVKNALGSPFWSGEGDIASSSDVEEEDSNVGEKTDSVSAAGLEMVELLVLAAQITKEKMGK